jgi:hypothetical protein
MKLIGQQYEPDNQSFRNLLLSALLIVAGLYYIFFMITANRVIHTVDWCVLTGIGTLSVYFYRKALRCTGK